MPLQFSCPMCGAKLAVPENLAGRRAKCPRCSSEFALPADDIAASRSSPNSGDCGPQPGPGSPPIAESKPPWTETRRPVGPIAILGVVFAGLGLMGMALGFIMAAYFMLVFDVCAPGTRIVNLGLLNDREIGSIAGVTIFVVGGIFVGVGVVVLAAGMSKWPMRVPSTTATDAKEKDPVTFSNVAKQVSLWLKAVQPGAHAPISADTQPSGPVGTLRPSVHKAFYLASIFGWQVPLFVAVIGSVFLGLVKDHGDPSSLGIGVCVGSCLSLVVTCLAWFYGVIIYFILLYKMWAAIQTGRARMTPGAAVGLLCVPIFNVYWYWQVIYGWAEDYNEFIAERAIDAPAASEKLAAATAVLPIIGLAIEFTRAIIFLVCVCASIVPMPGEGIDTLTGWFPLAFGVASVVVSYLFLNRAIDGLNSLNRIAHKGKD